MGTLLVTGSKPFAGLPDSPSQKLLGQVDCMQVGDHQVVAVATEVQLAKVAGNIRRLIAQHRPVAFVALGLAPGEPVLRCETSSINRLDFGVADNYGDRPTDGRAIEPGGPDGRLATWNAGALVRAMRDGGYPARVSHFAGTHLCNATLYCALGAMEAEGLSGPAGFFHLPYLPEQVVRFLDDAPPGGDLAPMTPRALPSMSLADQSAALRILLETLVHQAPGGTR
ncbi:Pyrrolidone-carboxylate peptidase [Marinibacterium anthonyi]|nr:Pyrrolidone-carboxylate peptidase [Marinibacterium anthonyi]